MDSRSRISKIILYTLTLCSCTLAVPRVQHVENTRQYSDKNSVIQLDLHSGSSQTHRKGITHTHRNNHRKHSTDDTMGNTHLDDNKHHTLGNTIHHSDKTKQTPVILPRTSFCTYNNRTFSSGERFQPDACTFCHCPRHSDRVQCSIQDCKSQANCVRYEKTNNRDCCGQCVEIGCKHTDNTVYKPSQVVSNTQCERCFCPPDGGKVQCLQTRCPPVNCVNPVKRNGDCCHRCPNGPNCWLGSYILPATGKAYRISPCQVCQCPSYPLPFWMRGRKIQALCSNICKQQEN